MSKSLQEQLLQSGAAKPKQAKKARKEKAAEAKAAKQQGKRARQGQVDPLELEIAKADAEKRARDRKLDEQRMEAQRAREQAYAVGQIIERNAIDAGDDVNYNYNLDGAIRRIPVSDAQRRDLADGRLAIVRHDDIAWLVNRAVAERLKEKVPDQVWLVQSDETDDPDDPYAEYQVPDDLVW